MASFTQINLTVQRDKQAIKQNWWASEAIQIYKHLPVKLSDLPRFDLMPQDVARLLAGSGEFLVSGELQTIQINIRHYMQSFIITENYIWAITH